MPMTTRADLYAPEVWSDLAFEAFKGRALVASSPAVTMLDELEGAPGETIVFPRWGLLGELDDLTEGVAMDTEKLTQSSGLTTIKEAGKAVEITDKAKLTGLGNAQDEAIRQFGILATRKIDADLIKAATLKDPTGRKSQPGGTTSASNPLEHTITGGRITWGGLVDALEKFGDDFEPSEFAGLYIRAEQRSQIMKDADFIRASELASAGGPGSMIRRGFIGEIAGLNVYVTNRLESGHALILKEGSLGLAYKQRPIVEQDRDILKRTTVVTTNLHYATHRLADDGVLDLKIEA